MIYGKNEIIIIFILRYDYEGGKRNEENIILVFCRF